MRDTPKPLLEVAGRAVPALAARLLRSPRGGRGSCCCVGYLGEQIEAAIGARAFGLDVRYAYDPPELAGTAGALRGALHLLGDRFLVLYGDTYLRIDYADVDRAFAAVGPAGADDRAAQRGPLGHLQRASSRRTASSATTRPRRRPTCTGSTTAWAS